MKFIQLRSNGEVYCFTEQLAKREDIDIIEAPEGSSPDDVKAALASAIDKMRAEAEAAAAEAERAHTLLVAPRTRKLTKVGKADAPLVTVEEAEATETAGA